MVSDRYLYEIAVNEFPAAPDSFPEDSEMRIVSASELDLVLVNDAWRVLFTLSKRSIDQNRDAIEECFLFTSAYNSTYHRNYSRPEAVKSDLETLSPGASPIEFDVPIAAIDRYVEALEHLLEVEEKEVFHELLLQIKTQWMEDRPDDWDEPWLAKD